MTAPRPNPGEPSSLSFTEMRDSLSGNPSIVSSDEPESLFITGRCRILRHTPLPHSKRRVQAIVAQHSISLADPKASKMMSFANELHVAELERAVKAGDVAAVARWGTICAQTDGMLDCRCAAHCSKGASFALCAPPLWLAAYRGDSNIVEVLLKAGASPNAVAQECSGSMRSCEVGGQTVLHLAVSRGSLECVQRLCSLRAQPDLPMCFALLSEDDEPEWNEATDQFEGGLMGLTVLQLAALRSTDERVCAALLAAGADVAPLASIPSTRPAKSLDLVPKLRLLKTDEGEPLDCPVCLEPIVTLSAEWTPCCVRGFHAHCLRGLDKCPLCRTRRRDGPRTLEPLTDAVVARSLQSYEGRLLAAEMSVERRQELATAALEIAFNGPQWMDGGTDYSHLGSFNSQMGSNYGWRCLARGAF